RGADLLHKALAVLRIAKLLCGKLSCAHLQVRAHELGMVLHRLLWIDRGVENSARGILPRLKEGSLLQDPAVAMGRKIPLDELARVVPLLGVDFHGLLPDGS